MTTTVSPHHDHRGKFAAGNKAGKGNPLARKTQQLRSVLLRSVGEGDLARAVDRLISLTQSNDDKIALLAIRELLDRTLGKSKPAPDDEPEPAAPGVDVESLSDADLATLARISRKALGGVR